MLADTFISFPLTKFHHENVDLDFKLGAVSGVSLHFGSSGPMPISSNLSQQVSNELDLLESIKSVCNSEAGATSELKALVL